MSLIFAQIKLNPGQNFVHFTMLILLPCESLFAFRLKDPSFVFVAFFSTKYELCFHPTLHLYSKKMIKNFVADVERKKVFLNNLFRFSTVSRMWEIDSKSWIVLFFQSIFRLSVYFRRSVTKLDCFIISKYFYCNRYGTV